MTTRQTMTKEKTATMMTTMKEEAMILMMILFWMTMGMITMKKILLHRTKKKCLSRLKWPVLQLAEHPKRMSEANLTIKMRGMIQSTLVFLPERRD